jgi:hypothetical protein
MEMPIVWFVSQISMPVRILLIGAAVFLAAWFTLLRPKSETVPPLTTSTTTTPAATSTPQTGLGKAVDAAKKAAGVKPEATATPATGTATTTTPETKPENVAIASVPAEELAKLPKSIATALKDRKVVVLGVLSEDAKPWRPLADDDRYVRNALDRTNRYDGEVVVKNVGLDELSTYGALVNDLNVTQSPSIVVIDRNLKGRVLTGYVDRVAINQVIADARRDSITPNLTDTFLRDANAACGNSNLMLSRWSWPTIRGKKALTAAVKRRVALESAFVRSVQRLHAPAKWRTLRTAWIKNAKAYKGAADKIVVAAKTGNPAKVSAAIDGYLAVYDAKLDSRFNKAGLTNCAINRTS